VTERDGWEMTLFDAWGGLVDVEITKGKRVERFDRCSFGPDEKQRALEWAVEQAESRAAIAKRKKASKAEG